MLFYGDDARVLFDHNLANVQGTFQRGEEPLCFEAAGPRRQIFFDPKETTCAIVTCGGLCPGLNDVIRSVVMQAYYRYGVPYLGHSAWFRRPGSRLWSRAR